MDLEKIKSARSYAAEMHAGQKRKFTGEPYIIHPEDTSGFIVQIDGDESMIVAALLHDILEDTNADPEYIRTEFGDGVLSLVEELTSNKIKQKELTKKIYLTQTMNNMSEKAFTIKLADRLSNILYLEDERTPEDFIEWYTKQTLYILDHLDREINENQEILIIRLRAAVLYIKNKREVI